MGAIVWSFENFINTMLDIVVIKTGLVISESYLLEILIEEFPEDKRLPQYEEKKDYALRIRSEDFDEYCWAVRQRLGELEEVSPLFFKDINSMMTWMDKGYDPAKIFSKLIDFASDIHDPENPKLIDPNEILERAIKENIAPVPLIIEVMDGMINNQRISNVIKPVEEILWDGGIELSSLFEKESIPKSKSDFIEQKFINFLQANPEKLEFMHWRNFERLTAEFFKRKGFEVELGPGTNDGGIDVRVYDKKDNKKPYIIIQCKRHKESNQVKIETVKSFYTDVEFEGAKKGLIATTSKVAVGGKKVASIRKYPLEFAENEEIKVWVDKMKKR
ncbi:restriction endonuclease [Hwangdonia sp.]|uniref:restriction endonuclease n=1 Tax=Hwangdonia sp. TaxID=1883432 RepID=UPI003AB523F5